MGFESHMFERVIIPNDKELEASLGVMLGRKTSPPRERTTRRQRWCMLPLVDGGGHLPSVGCARHSTSDVPK